MLVAPAITGKDNQSYDAGQHHHCTLDNSSAPALTHTTTQPVNAGHTSYDNQSHHAPN